MRAASAIAVAGALGGCTLFSGWSDLQGGSRHDASSDAGTEDESADASGQESSPPEAGPLMPTTCAAQCKPSNCCLSATGNSDPFCSSRCAPGDVALQCNSSTDCHGTTCCLGLVASGYTAFCTANCQGQVLCDPNDTTTCANGMTCQPGALVPFMCQ